MQLLTISNTTLFAVYITMNTNTTTKINNTDDDNDINIKSYISIDNNK